MSSEKRLPRIKEVEVIFYFSGNSNDYSVFNLMGNDESLEKLHQIDNEKLKVLLCEKIGTDMEAGKCLGFEHGIVNLKRVSFFRINIYREQSE